MSGRWAWLTGRTGPLNHQAGSRSTRAPHAGGVAATGDAGSGREIDGSSDVLLCASLGLPGPGAVLARGSRERIAAVVVAAQAQESARRMPAPGLVPSGTPIVRAPTGMGLAPGHAGSSAAGSSAGWTAFSGRWTRRTAAAMIATGALMACVTGALAETGPGHSLYGARLAFEALTLPSAGTPDRVEAQLRRMGTRVTEAEEATTRGETRALHDALDAYRETLADLEGAGAGNPSARANIEQELARNERSLAGLAARASPSNRLLVDDALRSTARVRRAMSGATRKHEFSR